MNYVARMNTLTSWSTLMLTLALWSSAGCARTTVAKAGAAEASASAATYDTIELGNGLKMKLRLIPAGTFTMGNHLAPEKTSDLYGGKGKERYLMCEYPQHEVTISKPFYIGVYEVSQAEWKAVTGTEPWLNQTQTKIGDNYPAAWMNSLGAIEYCKMLSKKTGRKVSLPSEAQWEYACRAGSTKSYCYDSDDPAQLNDYAWTWHNTRDGKPAEPYAHPVGLKKPNAWGLYDMHGNLWEFCTDRFDKEFYAKSPKVDPVNTTETGPAACRGGSWHNNSRLARSAGRGQWAGPEYVHYNYGFRIVVQP
jgi:formylglycine-generating enzyme required for sulfatase activity